MTGYTAERKCRRLTNLANPTKADPNSQRAGGSGTGLVMFAVAELAVADSAPPFASARELIVIPIRLLPVLSVLKYNDASVNVLAWFDESVSGESSDASTKFTTPSDGVETV